MFKQRLRSRLAEYTPPVLRKRIAAVRLQSSRRRNAARSVEDVFSEVYRLGQWGAGEEFDSGSRGAPATRYGVYVRDLIRETGARSAVDIGCGDFRVAAQFVSSLDNYIGLDVVDHLVARNSATYGTPGVRFALMDASTGELPDADICLIRQVLQYLSNDQIAGILERCKKYRLVLVTEHWTGADVASQPNIDKPHGPDTRLDRDSYVDITSEPFGCTSVEEVLRVAVPEPFYHPGETIRSVLWRP